MLADPQRYIKDYDGSIILKIVASHKCAVE